MRFTLLLASLIAIDSGGPKASDLQLIDQFNESVQLRFQAPQPDSLGMSRVANPGSFGGHFIPLISSARDFSPETPGDKNALSGLEAAGIQSGFYVFGRSIALAGAEELKYRALKGPAVITIGTPRPCWYPPNIRTCESALDALPDWKDIYPLAQRAMKSFADGGKGFETSAGSWHFAVRVVAASQQRCVTCHNGTEGVMARAALNQALGGVIYAYRHAPSAAAN
jgi:hypothetical protein